MQAAMLSMEAKMDARLNEYTRVREDASLREERLREQVRELENARARETAQREQEDETRRRERITSACAHRPDVVVADGLEVHHHVLPLVPEARCEAEDDVDGEGDVSDRCRI